MSRGKTTIQKKNQIKKKTVHPNLKRFSRWGHGNKNNSVPLCEKLQEMAITRPNNWTCISEKRTGDDSSIIE